MSLFTISDWTISCRNGSFRNKPHLGFGEGKIWNVKGGSAVRHVIGQCIACRKRNAKVGEQFMADLPSCRLQSFERPFYNTGIDYFGPFIIKQGRSLVKRYGCVFTCLTMRAVNIKIANSLTADDLQPAEANPIVYSLTTAQILSARHVY